MKAVVQDAYGDRTYPLSEAPDALRYLDPGHARGRIVITV